MRLVVEEKEFEEMLYRALFELDTAAARWLRDRITELSVDEVEEEVEE